MVCVWTDAGTIIFGLGSDATRESASLLSVSDQGGTPHSILDPEAEERKFHEPSPLPDGRGVLFVVSHSDGAPGYGFPADTLAVLADGRPKTVLSEEGEAFSTPIYATSGHVLYTRWTSSPVIWAVPFSLDRLEATGKPFPVSGGYLPSVSANGKLLYLEGNPRWEPTERLVWIDAHGNVEPIETREQVGIRTISLSPDENRALVNSKDQQLGGETSIWLHDHVRGGAVRLTFPPKGMHDGMALWQPDGEHFLFTRADAPLNYWPEDAHRKIMKARIDGSGEPQVVKEGALSHWFSLSIDGKHMAYGFQHQETGSRDLGRIALDGEPQPTNLRTTPHWERRARISPDGRLLAYESRESGTYEVYLTRFPSGDGRWLVGGGGSPVWGKDDKQQMLYYRDRPGNLYRVQVRFEEDDSEPERGSPDRLFNLRELGAGGLDTTKDK